MTHETPRQATVKNASCRVRKALGPDDPDPLLRSDGGKFPCLWRCVVLDVGFVALTIAVFAVLVLVLRGLERL